MLKRILVIGDVPEAAGKFAAGARRKDLVVHEAQQGDRLPDAAVALLAAGTKQAELLKTTVTLGNRYQAVLLLLGQALDAREGKPPGTTERVHEHASRFAQALELDDDDRIALEHAGYLSEIGKLRIGNEVLIKKSLLTYDEWTLIQSHTTLGAELLRESDVFIECADIVRCHHECYDGTGYPARIERDAIPRLSRAMRIIDVYCAMTTPRLYRKGFSTHDQAVAYLESERGKHFDPELLDVFIKKKVGKPFVAPASRP
ncbi:MAG TPA: HD domain-containing phosphohydrolase [Candidatus Hydrogenedentes bacterium]|nr:HD domain-containing phosphohydrolase [Candidatus Hydrogenedentota bacterium]HNT89261.1 HD domain-containing phosphohydrolase [Candidatus Hydrogenedentota bacterium]